GRGAREPLGVAAEIGWEALAEFVEQWFDYSERRMIQALERLPAGRVVGVSVHDPFPGTPEAGGFLRAQVTIGGARVEVDLTDNLDCLPSGLNLSESTARTAAMIGVFNGIGASVPPNAGSFRRVSVRL